MPEVGHGLVLQSVDELAPRGFGWSPFVLNDYQGLEHRDVGVEVAVGEFGAPPVHATVVGFFNEIEHGRVGVRAGGGAARR